MKFSESYSRAFQYLLPSPLSIAFILTLITFIIAYFCGDQSSPNQNYFYTLITFWEEGLWNPPLLVFTVQMMLMLVLGHMLALTPLVSMLINLLVKNATTTSKAAFIVTFSTILVALFNWGLGLIFGAIICRKIGESALQYRRELNYPLIGASGYVSLLVWHGGISGSATIKAAESGHLKSFDTVTASLPDYIPFTETVLSNMNLVCVALLIITLPLLNYLLGKKNTATDLSFLAPKQAEVQALNEKIKGAGLFDESKWISKGIGVCILMVVFLKAVKSSSFENLSFVMPNFINLMLFGWCVFFTKNISTFLQSLDKAIGGTAGILIQFPIYFGIMGVMKEAGLVQSLADFFVSASSQFSLPFYTLVSAGIVNIFVPSGGGQWAIQAPVLLSAATELNASLPKTIMAFAYGDQLTNMLQPFWALPLLGITKLKAKEIIPYTLIMMVVALLVFLSVLVIF